MKRVFAIKGSSEPGKPIVSRPTKNSMGRVKLFMIGTDTAKETIFARLKIEEFGPGYVHYYERLDDEFFKQLTAERIVTRYTKGMPKREWVKIRARNEALDMFVYNMAALAILNPNLEKLVKALEVEKEEVKQPESEPKPSATEKSSANTRQHRLIQRTHRNWIRGWK
jgi:phage terminase large subunit GpA-like protein